jgi:hypothetical protein
MGADTGQQRDDRRARSRSASTRRSNEIALGPVREPVQFEVHGGLSDQAIESLASLLLAIVDQERADNAEKGGE